MSLRSEGGVGRRYSFNKNNNILASCNLFLSNKPQSIGPGVGKNKHERTKLPAVRFVIRSNVTRRVDKIR